MVLFTYHPFKVAWKRYLFFDLTERNEYLHDMMQNVQKSFLLIILLFCRAPYSVNVGEIILNVIVVYITKISLPFKRCWPTYKDIRNVTVL